MEAAAATAASPERSFHPRCSRCTLPWPSEEIRRLRSLRTVLSRPIQCECGARMGEVERLFYQLDTNGNGKLDHKELRVLSHRLFSYDDGNAVADPADIDGAEAELAAALDEHNCVWEAERVGLGLVCRPDDFEIRDSGCRVRKLKTTPAQLVERVLAAKKDKSFSAKVRDAETAFRGMLDEIKAADSSAVTRDEFSKWWKQIGSELQKQQREQQREQQQQQHSELEEPENELETDEEEDNAHEHETTVYLKSLEAVEDEHTGKRSHIDYYFDVRVFGVSRYRFHGRFSRLLDVHTQMQKAGCLDEELRHGLEFPRKSGLLEAAIMVHTTSDAKVQERGDELCRYYQQIFASQTVMQHPRTKAILGFDKSDVDVARELMKDAHMKKAKDKASIGGKQAELRRRTPRWGEAKKDYTREKYGQCGWQDGDLEIRKRQNSARGDIVVVGLHSTKPAGDDATDFDEDDWCEGILRFPAKAHGGCSTPGQPQLPRGNFPRKGFKGKDETPFIDWLSVADVAGIIRDHGVDYKLVRAEHRFDKATYGADWDETAHKGTWDEKAQEFMKGEYLVLVAQPHSDGWGQAVTFQKFSEGLGPSEGNDWVKVAKFIPALPGFVSDAITDGNASGFRFAWESKPNEQ